MNGRLIWLTGLPGAGKTTVGQALYKRRKAFRPDVVRLDGDELRRIFDDHDYSVEGRLVYGLKVCRLCQYLVGQNLEVICCVVGMKEIFRQWNRENIPCYCEVYLRISEATRLHRNQKGLYGQASPNNVVGKDILMEEPSQPDLVFNNDGEYRPEQIALEIDDYLRHMEQ